MNSFSQNTYTMRYKHNVQWDRNMRPYDHRIQRQNNFNSPWQSQSGPGCENYWCETCDKGFITQALLDYHKQRHQRCNIDGCQFVAHPKVITKHIQMQHSTGLYKRIGKLNDPEEIKKWREERKRKYPTKENIEKRLAEVKEKIRRGEKMGLKHDKQGMNNYKSGLHNKRHQNIHKKYNKMLNQKKTTSQLPTNNRPVKNSEHNTIPPKEEFRKLQPFMGIQNLIINNVIEDDTPEESNTLIEDDEEVTPTEVKEKTNLNPTVCGALTTLICNYESSDDEGCEEHINAAETSNNNTDPTVNPKVNVNGNNGLNVTNPAKELLKNNVIEFENKIACHVECENDSGPEETKITKQESTVNSNSLPTKHVLSRRDRLKKFENLKSKHKYFNLKRKLPSTLLEKLLHKEIQHERNIILQCIRYVVKSKYFDNS